MRFMVLIFFPGFLWVLVQATFNTIASPVEAFLCCRNRESSKDIYRYQTSKNLSVSGDLRFFPFFTVVPRR